MKINGIGLTVEVGGKRFYVNHLQINREQNERNRNLHYKHSLLLMEGGVICWLGTFIKTCLIAKYR